MSASRSAPVELVFLWHHHQPDYRSPHDGRAVLPWVRLHATKDYLDMALRLERHPGLRATFNFVPTLIDQLEALGSGGSEALFDVLRKPVGALEPGERAEILRRCRSAPPHAFERWPAYRSRVRHLALEVDPTSHGDREVLALEVWFLLAWLDPMFLDEPEVRAALAAARPDESHRDDLLALSDRLVREVVPVYARMAARGQIELSASAYTHPILPLLVDLRTARRARPDLPVPDEPLRAPDDAARQVARALERHEAAFGVRAAGMWPPEGGVSPEVAEIVARAGVRWLASDEGVLWRSLPEGERVRQKLYQPWRVTTPAGDVALFFRDRDLSDRIGFVYAHWDPEEAAADFVARVRRIGREQAHGAPAVVSVILDGENCWEHYADDGAPFLDALYLALDRAEDVRTTTPSAVLEGRAELPALGELHSGSWIDADFHVWIGHPEKNRAWDLLARARRALVDAGLTPGSHPAAWQSLDAAEGSDWFWWFGDDHFTHDKNLFDRIFREHLEGVYRHAGLEPPGALRVPVVRAVHAPDAFTQPIGFVRPVLDGWSTQFYEWHAAGTFVIGAGGSMHRGAGLARRLFYGFDEGRFYLRLDFLDAPPGADMDLAVEVLAPRPLRCVVRGLAPGGSPVEWADPERAGLPVPGAECRIGRVLELGIPFEALDWKGGEPVEMIAHLLRAGASIETVPSGDMVRFTVPEAGFDEAMWSV